MDRQQLDRGHAEVAQVVGDRRRRQAGVRPAQVLGHPVVQGGHALDVHLVDHGVAPAAAHRGVAAPVEGVVDDDAAGDVRRGVLEVRARRGCPGRSRRPPGSGQVARDRLAVGVEQQLVRVEAQPLLGPPRPVDAVAVAGARARRRGARRARCPGSARSAAWRVSTPSSSKRQTQAWVAGGRVDREVGRLRRPGRPQRVVPPRPHLRRLAQVAPHSRCHPRHCPR